EPVRSGDRLRASGRSRGGHRGSMGAPAGGGGWWGPAPGRPAVPHRRRPEKRGFLHSPEPRRPGACGKPENAETTAVGSGQYDHCDRKDGQLRSKSTRLNSSHVSISYAVFCLKKKTATSFGVTALARIKAASCASSSAHSLKSVIRI